MEFAVEVEADNATDLNILIQATETWLGSLGATIFERNRDDEECVAWFLVKSRKDLRESDGVNVPGKVTIEPL